METTTVEIRTGDREQVVDLTGRAEEFLRGVGAVDGLLHVFVPHATAGVAVIETGAGSGWTHRHGSPGHGRDHVLPGLVPPYASRPVVGGRLALGTWQSVVLVDTNVDNPVRSVRFSYLAG